MSVFISYRREGGLDLAGRIYDNLKNEYDVFYDVENMKSGKFSLQIYDKIEKSEDFLLILSPNALDRCINDGDWVRLEICKAIECKKNIILIWTPKFNKPAPEYLPEDINEIFEYQAIIRPTDGLFEAFIEKLKSYLKSKPLLKNKTILLKDDCVNSNTRLQKNWLKKFKSCCERAFGYSDEIDYDKGKSSDLFFFNNVLCFMDCGNFIITFLTAEDIFDIRYAEGDEFNEASVVILFKNGYSLYYYGFDNMFNFDWMLNGATTGSLCGKSLKEFFAKNGK